MNRIVMMFSLALLTVSPVSGEDFDSLQVCVQAGDSCMKQYDTYEALKYYQRACEIAKAEAVEKAVANATMEVPEAMIQSTQEQMAEDFAYRLQSQGLKLEQYFQFTGLNQKTFLEQMKPQAEKRINTRLVLEAIVKAENITVSDEEIEEELKKMSEQFHMEIDKIKEYMGEENLKNMTLDLACGKAVTLVADSAVEA